MFFPLGALGAFGNQFFPGMESGMDVSGKLAALGGQPGDLPASPYPMPGVSSPYSTGMGGIGAMGDNFGFKRDQGHGWNMSYGGPS